MFIGALMGLATSIVPEGLDILRRYQEHNQELELMRLNAEIARQQAEQKMQEAELKVDAAHMTGVYDQFKAQRTANWVDKVNAMVRPAVTLAFVGLFLTAVGAIVFQAVVLGSSVAAAMTTVLPLISEYVSAILAFWFGNRQIARNRGKA